MILELTQGRRKVYKYAYNFEEAAGTVHGERSE